MRHSFSPFRFGSITLRLVGEPAEPQRAEKSNHPFGASTTLGWYTSAPLSDQNTEPQQPENTQKNPPSLTDFSFINSILYSPGQTARTD